MLTSWYRRTIGRFVFRKLNIGIGITLLLVFLSIGFMTYSRFYQLLEDKASTLLETRTNALQDYVSNMITQFKRETISFYPLSQQTPGLYARFIADRIPLNEQELLAERNYFNGVQSHLLERNPDVTAVFMYRNADSKLYYKSRHPSSSALNPAFDFTDFFASFPLNYDYPYIGQTDQLFRHVTRPMLYLVIPVFDFANIKPDQAQGYFMAAIDARTLFDRFQPASSSDSDSRVLVRHNGQVLLDSKDGSPLPEAGILTAVSPIERYSIEIAGIVDKSAIESDLSQITTMIVLGLLAAWALCMVLIHYIQRFVNVRLRNMTQHFKLLQTNPFTEPMEEAGEDEIGDLIHRFNRMTKELQDYIKRVYISDIRKRNAEYVALKMQINPHFLYNTLESLRMQAVIRKQMDIADKLYYLGKLYRWILKTDAEEIAVEEELQYTRYYLDLFMMGKSRQIEIQTITELDLRDCYLPKFCLQPIVENAILHGQLEKAERPVITLEIRLKDDMQLVEISNNGIGATLAEQEKLNESLQTNDLFQEKHLGLKNIHERIRSYYGNEYGLFVKPTMPEQGFTIVMKLPKSAASYEGETIYG